MNSTIDYLLYEISKNCRNQRKKTVAIKHLTSVMETLKLEDNLRLKLWEIIKCLEQIESETDFYNDE